ncbi:hypothetical protein [Candidatus Albibeggiatoa sp. nov. BB20]|uniref:hypothetical protein n=1 Tax=Candidatus Albibeggiatoa sp. nov. BB20 TaxID=3162723 RepID=UPI0033658586
MLLSRTTIFLTFCFSFNLAIADDAINDSTAYMNNPHELYSDQLRPRKRGQNQQVKLPSAWAANASQGGALCYIDPEQVLLWRDDATFASRLSIKAKGSKKTLNLRWAKNQDTLKWPYKRVQLIPNNTYYLKLNQREAASQIITSKQLPKHLWNADKAKQAAWMQANECILQANYLQQTTTQ